MTDETIQNQHQVLEKLVRQERAIKTEPYRVVSGSRQGVSFAAKVISKENYNLYNVAAVEIGSAGTIPTAIGAPVCAVNVAEPFLSQGTLPAGTFIIISRVGDKYVFFAKA